MGGTGCGKPGRDPPGTARRRPPSVAAPARPGSLAPRQPARAWSGSGRSCSPAGSRRPGGPRVPAASRRSREERSPGRRQRARPSRLWAPAPGTGRPAARGRARRAELAVGGRCPVPGDPGMAWPAGRRKHAPGTVPAGIGAGGGREGRAGG